MSAFINFATAIADEASIELAPARQRMSFSASGIYAASSLVMFFHGVGMWWNYPHQIDVNNEIVERPSDVADWDYTTLDKTWALGTLEMTAWTFASRISAWSFGTGFTLWALNNSLDNEGGDLHKLFYRSVQFQSVITPFLMVAAAGRLFAAHSAGPSVSNYEKAYWNTFMSEAWGNPHFYDYSTTNSANYRVYE